MARTDTQASPLVKAAIALLALTAAGGAFLIFKQLSPKPRVVSEPPPLVVERPPEPPPAVEEPPVPPPPAPVAVAKPAVTASVPAQPSIDSIPIDHLGGALMDETNPDRKLAMIRRLQKHNPPSGRYAVAVLFPDPDKRVRLEAIRAVEAMDAENRVLMPKVHAVYMYEQDPEVKAELDRLVQKFRPQEEAEYKARQAAAGQTNAPP